MPGEEAALTRLPLTAPQQRFFQRHRTMMLELAAAMKGALQLIADEHGLTGAVSVSDDGMELIIENHQP